MVAAQAHHINMAMGINVHDCSDINFILKLSLDTYSNLNCRLFSLVEQSLCFVVTWYVPVENEHLLDPREDRHQSFSH